MVFMLGWCASALGAWSSVPGEGQVLGVASDGSAWAVQIVLPTSASENHGECGYPSVDEITPAAMTLALCKRSGSCEAWPIYTQQPCTNRDTASAALTAAQNAFLEAGVPWDSPRAFVSAPSGSFALAEGSLSRWGLHTAVDVHTHRARQPDGTTVQYLVFTTGEGGTAQVPMTTYTAYEGALSWVDLRRVTTIAEAGVLFGFLEGACCGADMTATQPFVVELDGLVDALKQSIP